MLSTRPPQLSVVLRCLSASGVRWVTTTSQGSQHLASHPKTGEVKVSNPATIEDLKQNLRIQFSRAKLGHFTQTPPYQDNLFTNNAFLTSYLTRVLPQHVRDEIWSDLTRFGQRAVTDIYQLGRECELNQPYVRTFDAWGNRTDELVTCQAWKDLKKISAEEGLIAAAYEGKYKEYDRLYQMVKLFIFSPVSGLYSCPLAMTDGAAKTARMMKSPHLQEAYEHLTSRDPQHFWTSGQWMTEKRGTRQLPTAELLLDGSVAHQVSAEGRGIASIANMLTITRMHNAMSSCAVMRRIIQLARDYSLRRSAFGQVVESHPLHQLTASRMEVTTRACEALTFHMARLLGREEAGVATSQESLVLRTLTPIMKFFTAKMAMKIISEALECFGGQGYIEDTGLPSHLRDAQVLPIWEGTTNIMSLDFLRAMAKSKGEALTAVYDDVKARIEEVTSIMTEDLQDSCHKVTQSMDELTSFLQQHPHLIQPAARDIATSVAHIYIGSLLLEHAAWEKSSNSKEVAKRWCQQRLTCLTLDEYSADNKALYMEGYNLSEIYGPMF
ncbi:Acyl-CoA dehydrogenase family member 11-like [Homarus americanus]|uniref:Acyl-CoA dehydrogenase family member 11-like n=1 Tax=Homarus americanus TaxID=6706 RepID=A0A8J5JSK7_HOMAM|nr:Acyl-CoA dehydrogenase family member 11-like [Homarus americanus]